MSLITYNSLSQDNTLGIKLPQLIAADLENQLPCIVSAKDAITKINAFSAQQGWISYRDSVKITADAPDNEYFIEAQYCNGNDSLHVKLVNDNKYQINTFNASKPIQNCIASATKAYSEQEVVLRNNLVDQAKTATYRLWWQLENDEKNKHFGRWLPLTQQFVGFNNSAQGESS